jgi:hypothetical protein
MSTYITRLAKELGLKTIDARKPLLLEVRPVDIKGADKKNPESCALARACCRAEKADEAFFFRTTAWLRKGDVLIRYHLPPSVQKEIVSFDRNKTMEPGTYQLSKPDKSHKMSAVKKRSEKRPGRHKPARSGIKRKFTHRTTDVRGLTAPE